MCGIVGIFNNQKAFSKVKTGLKIIQNRGKDGFGIASFNSIYYHKNISQFKKINKENIVGHVLHAVVDNVSQPIKKQGILVANCEIYNWQELNKKYHAYAKNDAEFLLRFLDKFNVKKIDELDGVYAFAYWDDHSLVLARDIFGEKPLWFSYTTDGFSFASEKKVLEKLKYTGIQELNPRHVLIYNIKEQKISMSLRSFFNCLPEHNSSYHEIKQQTRRLIDEAIVKRIPHKKFGLLFSGGIDSTYLAHYFKQHNYNFTCYTAVLDSETTPPSDLIAAKKIAKELNLKLKIKKIKLSQIIQYLRKIVPLIEDSNVVKVGVALTFYLACELAKKDGCKVIFSGLGSEEIFAGYERHKHSSNINKECVSGLLKMYERDLYRDDVVTMDNNLELRLPFLDKNLVDYALKIPEQYKIKDGIGKFVLREIAIERGIPAEFSFRKKTAAQYGSKFDYAIEKLAKHHGFVSKSSYLRTFYPTHNLKLGVLFSGGKDSTYAAYIMQRQNYQLACLITLKSRNPYSYMFHTPAIEITELQAEAMGIPIITQKTKGEKEKELEDLRKAIVIAKENYKIDGIITGAVFSTYQRDRIEQICDEVGLKIFSPLWHKPQEQELQELLQHNFHFILTSIAAEGLDKTWLNKEIALKEVERLTELKKKYDFHVTGEGGEFESLVIDCPLFKKKINIENFKIVEEKKYLAKLLIKKATLQLK